METDCYKAWAEMRKVKLNLAISIHCPILVSLSRVFALKKKIRMYLSGLTVDAFFSTDKPGPNIVPWPKMISF